MSTKFIISKKLSAYLVAVNDCEVVVEPYHDEVRRLGTANVALAIQNLSGFVLKIRKPLDPCDFLLEFFAGSGWKIEEADIEVLPSEL